MYNRAVSKETAHEFNVRGDLLEKLICDKCPVCAHFSLVLIDVSVGIEGHLFVLPSLHDLSFLPTSVY